MASASHDKPGGASQGWRRRPLLAALLTAGFVAGVGLVVRLEENLERARACRDRIALAEDVLSGLPPLPTPPASAATASAPPLMPHAISAWISSELSDSSDLVPLPPPGVAATWAGVSELDTSEAWVARAMFAQARGETPVAVHATLRAWDLAEADLDRASPPDRWRAAASLARVLRLARKVDLPASAMQRIDTARWRRDSAAIVGARAHELLAMARDGDARSVEQAFAGARGQDVLADRRRRLADASMVLASRAAWILGSPGSRWRHQFQDLGVLMAFAEDGHRACRGAEWEAALGYEADLLTAEGELTLRVLMLRERARRGTRSGWWPPLGDLARTDLRWLRFDETPVGPYMTVIRAQASPPARLSGEPPAFEMRTDPGW